MTAHFIALVLQFGFAIGLLAGRDFLLAHAQHAWVVAGLGALQILLLFVAGSARVGPYFLAAACIGMLLVVAQLRIAWSFATPTHVSLALLYWGISFALLIKVWKPEWSESVARGTA